MTTPHDSADQPAVPPLSDLLSRYLARQAGAHQAGLAAVDASGEVSPYEAIPVQSIDPRLAWHEAVAVARFYEPSLDTGAFSLPPDWSSLVANQEPAAAVSFCFANFPQLVRNLQALLRATDPTKLQRNSNQPVSVPSIVVWAERTAQGKDLAQALLSAGVLRLARQFESAGKALQRLRAEAATSWQAQLANEEASLAWSRGQFEQAAALWQSQEPSVPVLFNRGMAAIFLGRPNEARPWLQQAVEQLPETDGWHHLGRLYLALA